MGYRDNYEAWLRDFAEDEATIADLQAIAGDEKEIEDRFYKNLSFGTAGMRGVLGAGMNRMNVYTVRRATQGLADYLSDGEKKRGVVIAYDSRRMSAEFAKETALVLCANGVKTYLFDALRPVALLSFGVRHLGAAAGVVITASHNPPQYNGYKVYGEDGAQLGPEAAAAVTERINALSFTAAKRMDEEAARAAGLLNIIGNKEVDDEYIARVKTLSINPEIVAEAGKNLKIVYTPLHGSGNVPVRRILREIGVTNVSVVKEQEAPDPNFSTVQSAQSGGPRRLHAGHQAGQRGGRGRHLRHRPGLRPSGRGGARDGRQLPPADRQSDRLPDAATTSSLQKGAGQAACQRRRGQEHRVHRAGARHLQGLRRGAVRHADGLQVYRRKDSAVPGYRRHTFLFGFEESYGFSPAPLCATRTASTPSLLIAEAACYYSTQGKTLCDVMAEIFQRYGYYLEHVESTYLPGIDGLKVMAEIMARIRKNPPVEIGGVKVARVLDIMAGTETDVATGKVTKLDYPESDVLYFAMEGGHFVCVRPSGTEPKIKLYVNVNDPDQAKAQELLEHLTAEAQKLLK